MLAKRRALCNGAVEELFSFVQPGLTALLWFVLFFASLWEKNMQGRVWIIESMVGPEAWTLIPFSHELSSCPLELRDPLSLPCSSTFSRTFAIAYAAQREFPPCLKCVGPTSQPRRHVTAPLWGLFPKSHLWWETNGGCDSQGYEPDSKLENAMKWMGMFCEKMVLAGRGWAKRRQNLLNLQSMV